MIIKYALYLWVLFLVVVMRQARLGGATTTNTECQSNSQDIARLLFAHWSQHSSHHRDLIAVKPKHDNTTAVLHKLGQLLPDERCLSWFEWDPTVGLSYEKPQLHHCQRKFRQPTPHHLLLYSRWLEHAIRTHGAAGHLRRRFHFYIDLSRAHRHSPELAEALGAPILVQSKWASDNYSIPIPAAHLVAGHLLALGHTIKEAAVLQRGAAHIYNASAAHAPRPWAERTPRLVFRSCCKPTPDTRSATAPADLHPLGDLCTATQGLQGFDISVSLCSLWATCESGGMKPLCDGCLACVQHRARVPNSLRGSFRYELVAPAPTSAADGTLQQLLTGSAVLALRAEGVDGQPLQLHEQWYSPLLQDRTHYLITTPKQLPATKQWCDDNADACRQVAEAGRRVATCDITPEAGLLYTWQVLKHIHDLTGPK